MSKFCEEFETLAFAVGEIREVVIEIMFMRGLPKDI